MTPDEVAEAIRHGEFDNNNGIKVLLDAITLRFQVGQIGLRWRIDLPDLSVHEDELLFGEAEQIERESRVNWTEIKPPRSARECGAVLRACYQHRNGLSADAAREKVAAMCLLEIVNAFSEEQVEQPPKDSAS